MNWDQISGQWTQLRGSLREKWGKLTDDDLELAAGNKDKLAGLLQERYGLAKDHALESLDKFIADLKPPTKST
ncbi:MAG TPA: CsbD family protein [Polyangiales bacterium]|nr:CsbD family protein [Polyangiales bacterium]